MLTTLNLKVGSILHDMEQNIGTTSRKRTHKIDKF